MKIDYNREKLKQILDNLYNIMKINMAIVDVDFNFLYSSGEDAEFCKKIQATKKGAEKCFCSFMLMSKNSLYKNFHNFFGCTINEYILSERINKAKTLILENKEKLCCISDKVGIPNYTYFCRIFKKHTGYPPSKYKEISLKCM